MTLALTAFIKNRQIDGIYSSRKVGTVKAPKPIENQSMELEMNLEADNNKLEDYTMNQVLLDQTVKYFEGSMQGLQQTGSTYNESVRVVYRQMLDMVDQLLSNKELLEAKRSLAYNWATSEAKVLDGIVEKIQGYMVNEDA